MGTYEVGIAQCTKALLHASQYVFWDAAYPSERAKRLIDSQLLQEYASSFSR